MGRSYAQRLDDAQRRRELDSEAVRYGRCGVADVADAGVSGPFGVGALRRRSCRGLAGVRSVSLARRRPLVARSPCRAREESPAANQRIPGPIRRARRRPGDLRRHLRRVCLRTRNGQLRAHRRRRSHLRARDAIHPLVLRRPDLLPRPAPRLAVHTTVSQQEAHAPVHARRRYALVAGRDAPVILGIETSCDETAAALITREGEIRADIVASQADLHARYGGVVPEVASRRHLELVIPVVREALGEAHASLDDVELVGVTSGPGLIGALLVGLAAAKAIAWSKRL